MHRTQLLLEERQYQRLKSLAQKQGRSLSSLVREAIADFLGKDRKTPATTLADIAGIGSDSETRGRDHDDVLYGPRRDRS